MSDITINSSENQEDNQKTTPVTGSPSEPNDSSLSLSGEIFSTWLGIRDGNITFKDDSLDFNISEIESVYQDCMRDQPKLCEKTHDMYEKYDLYDNIIVMTNMGDKK